MKSSTKFELILHSFFLLGICISIYAYHVESSAEKSKSYKPLCDIGPHVSCSKVLTSEYSKGFGIVSKIFGKDSFLNVQNCFYGMIFYTLLSFLYMVKPKNYNIAGIVLAVISNCGSLYLAYLLTFVLHDLCLVCVSIYIVNAVILYLEIRLFQLSNKSIVKYKST